MTRDLRDVVNKIIVAISDDLPTTEEIADLSSDLSTFFDASVVLVYLGKMPLIVPQSEGLAAQTQVGAAMNVIDDNARKTLDRMVEIMSAHGVRATSRVVISAGSHVIRDIIEEEKCDLVVLPNWETGTTHRLLRVFSPSILEEATCPVLVLKGNKWLTDSKAARPGKSESPPEI
jgi:nucleotide-binding universal stress UspA family protein